VGRRHPPVGDAHDRAASGALDATPVAAPGDVIAEGYVALLFESAFQVEPQLLDVVFFPWAPADVDPFDAFGHLEREPYSGAALDVGDCGTVTKPPPPDVTPLDGGDAIVVVAGDATLPLEDEGDDYEGRDETSPADFLGAPLSLVAGAGSAPLGGPGTLALGAIPQLTAEADTVSCTRGVACDLGVTFDAADEVYVAIALGPVCRLDPAAAPAVPPAAFSALSDGPYSLRLYVIRRDLAALGAGRYEVFQVHELALPFELVTP
jgi:hypothetical protein